MVQFWRLNPLRSVRWQLLLSYLAVLLPVIVFGVLWAERSVSDQYAVFRQRAESEASRVANQMESLQARARTMGESLAELPAVKAQRIDDMNAILERQLALDLSFNNISFVNAQGVRVATGLQGSEGNVYLGDRLYFLQAMATGKPAIGEAIISRGGKVRDHPIVTVSVPVRDDLGRLIGVVTVSTIVEQLQKEISGNKDPRGLYAFVVDQNGKTVIHPNAQLADQMKDMSHLAPVQAALRGESGYTEFTDPADNLPYLAVYQPVPNSPWGVVAVQPLNPVQSGMRQAATAAGGIVFVSLLLALGFATVIGGGLSDGIGRLARTAQAVGAGDLGRQVEISRADEVGVLAQSFNRMSSDLASLVTRLSESERALRGAYEEIGGVLAASGEAEEILQVALRTGARYLGVEGAALGLLDEERRLIRWRYSIGPGSLALVGVEQSVDDSRLLGSRVISSRRAGQSVPDAIGAGDPLLWTQAAAVLALPLIVRGTSIGVMALFDGPSRREFKEEEVKTAQSFANQVAAAVDNVRAHAEIRRLLYELEEKNELLAQQNEELAAQNEEIRTQNEEIHGQYAELNAQRAELAELANEAECRAVQLDAANKELEAFSFSVSHDLRAPLRHIDGFARILLQDHADRLDEHGTECLRVIRDGVERMRQLIDDMLKLSRITMADMNREPVDLTALAHSIASQLQSAQPERKVDVFILPGLLGNGDPRLMRVALENLLGNAWKFTAKRSDAKIVFGHAQQDGKNVFYVQDNGAGFDMAYADKLFGVFQRLHSTEEFPGTGVGLATVQRILRRHGGQIWAEGEAGKGATFYFTLDR